tara:strand:+ start:2282 stop:2626 length:345 start_codon:yes stop_codon:yes gene_type:complete
MFYLLSKILLGAFSLLIAAKLIVGVEVHGLYVAIVAALVLGLLNTIVKPILVVLTLPITIITLGLFTFVINALLFLFAASFLEGFAVEGFLPALLGSLVVSVVNTIGLRFIGKD